MLLYGDPWLYPYGFSSGADCSCACFEGRRGPGSSCCAKVQSIYFGIPFFRALASFFPRLPENMLGGIIGWGLGTHPLRNNYDSNSGVVRALSHPCWSVSNRSEAWRGVVYQWLHERDAFEAVSHSGQTVAEQQGNGRSFMYGRVVVEREKGCFTVSDAIYNFEDYARNCCWICQEPAEEWDMWSSCRHAFCKKCSSEMLRRRMPCAMCRVHSARVVRRSAEIAGVLSAVCEEEEATKLLPAPQMRRDLSRGDPQRYGAAM